jgi:hypothetical protein
MVDGGQKLTIQYYIALSCLTNNLYQGGEIYFKQHEPLAKVSFPVILRE